MSSEDFVFHIMLFGDNDRYKIFQTICGTDCWIPMYSCIPIDFVTKKIVFQQKKIKLGIWEPRSTSYEAYRYMCPCRIADSLIIVFTINCNQSLVRAVNIMETIVDTFNKSSYERPEIILVGTKCNKSIEENEREVSRERSQIICDDYDMRYIEVDSETGYNIQYLFDTLLSDLLKIFPDQ